MRIAAHACCSATVPARRWFARQTRFTALRLARTGPATACKNPPPASPFTHNPPEQDAVYSRPEGPGHMVMGGREVYKFATKVMPQSLLQACEKAGIQAGELDWIVPHQANVRIVQTAMDRLGLPMEKAWMTIDHTGNTSSASIPIALDELHRAGRVRRGDKIGLSGFGAGLIYASLVFEW